MGGGEEQGMERVYFVVPQSLCVHLPPLCWQMSADYDRLSLLQKVEVFEHALESTRGDDLAKVLWLKSPNSEVDGCTGGTASCAVLSWWSCCVCAYTRAAGVGCMASVNLYFVSPRNLCLNEVVMRGHHLHALGVVYFTITNDT